MKSTINRALALLMLMLVGLQLAAAQIPVPDAGHRVTDLAQVLNVSDKESLASQLESLETRTHAQVGILIVPTLQQEPIEALSQRVFNSWGLGRAGVNDGVLMVLSVQDRKVRIHVGRGLDGTLPESVATRIIRERMGPAFREKQYATGFSRAIEAISGPIAEHSQVTPASTASLTTDTAAPATAKGLMQPDTAKPESNLGWALLAVGVGVASTFIVVIVLQRKARHKEAAEQEAAQEREEMRRQASLARDNAYRAAEEHSRREAARLREERAAQNNASSTRSRATSYPSSRSTSSSPGSASSRTASSSSSSRPSSTKSSLSESSSSAHRHSSSRDDDDYNRRNAAVFTPSVSTYDSGPSSSSSSNSSSWGGGDSGGGGGSGDY